MRLHKMCAYFLVLLLSVLVLSTNAHSHLHRIAFGSCFDPNNGGAIWQLIDSFVPNHLVLLGDQIYADKPIGYYDNRTPDIIKREYDLLTDNECWKHLHEHLDHWSAVYDDHDYGVNNGDKTFPHRNASQNLFREFAASALKGFNSASRSGVYSSKTISIPLPSGSSVELNNSDIDILVYKLILLDTRSNKDPKGTKGGDFLGAEQWEWLAKELADPTPDLIFLGSSIQILPDNKLVEETWSEFPFARQKLLGLVTAASFSKNVVLLSGDIHRGEVISANCTVHAANCNSNNNHFESNGHTEDECSTLDADLWEFTSSGLGHTFSEYSYDIGECDSIAHTRQSLSSHQNIITDRSSVNGESNYFKVEVATRKRGFLNSFLDWIYQAAYPGYFRPLGHKDMYEGMHFATVDIVAGSLNGDSANEINYHLVVSYISTTGEVVIKRSIPLFDRRSRAIQRNCTICDDIFKIYLAASSKVEERIQHMNILKNGYDGSSGVDKLEMDCVPYWGQVPIWRKFIYRGAMALTLLLLVVLPIVIVLWFVAASAWYICIGSEIRRRKLIEKRYQEKQKQQ